MNKNTTPTRVPDSMLESHFMQLFLALDNSAEKICSEFIKYVKTQYAGKEELLKLLEYCSKKLKEGHNPKAKCWDKVRTYNIVVRKSIESSTIRTEVKKKNKINNLLHELNQALQRFLIQKHIGSSEFDKSYILAKIYEKYNLTNLFQAKIYDMQSALDTPLNKDGWWHLSMFKTGHIEYFHTDTPKTEVSSQLLIQMYEHVTSFAKKIQNQIQTEYYSITKKNIFNKIKEKQKKTYLEEVQELSMYPNYSDYLKLKIQFKSQLGSYSVYDVQKIMVGMMNVVARLQDLDYKEKLSDSYYFYSIAATINAVQYEELNSNLVLNLVLFLSESQEFEEAKLLLQKYQDIHDDYDFIEILNSIISFYKNEFSRCYFSLLPLKGDNKYQESLCLIYLLLSLLCLRSEHVKTDLKRIHNRIIRNELLHKEYLNRITCLYRIVRKGKNPHTTNTEMKNLINEISNLPMKDWLVNNIYLRNTDNWVS